MAAFFSFRKLDLKQQRDAGDPQSRDSAPRDAQGAGGVWNQESKGSPHCVSPGYMTWVVTTLCLNFLICEVGRMMPALPASQACHMSPTGRLSKVFIK